MQFVNLTTRNVYTTLSGNLGPGDVSSGLGKSRRKLEETLEEIVKTCGDRLGVRLSEREAQLVNKLMDLDDRGCAFNRSSIPDEIRKDPYGEDEINRRVKEAQKNGIEATTRKNAEAAKREAIINGEIEERKPVGPATLKGDKFDPSSLKTGFEKIMEENERIAAGKSEKKDVKEIMDPIGAHMKPGSEVPKDSETEAPAPIVVPMAGADEDDATKSANAQVPQPVPSDRRNKMDARAAEVAGKLSIMGSADNAPVAAKKRGRGRASGESKGKSEAK